MSQDRTIRKVLLNSIDSQQTALGQTWHDRIARVYGLGWTLGYLRMIESGFLSLLAAILISLFLSLLKSLSTSGSKGQSHEESVLFVCTKCAKNKKQQSPEDIEDLVDPDGVRLWKQVISNLSSEQDAFALASEHKEHMIRVHKSEKIDSGQIDPQYPIRCYRHVASGEALRVVPFRCLSLCDEACSIALSSSRGNRFSYQFAGLDCDAQTAQDIVHFVSSGYVSQVGYSKNKSRPSSLRKSIRARIPPAISIPTSPPSLSK